MTYIQFSVQTTREPGSTWRATARPTGRFEHKEYRGQGTTEYQAAEDAASQLLRDCTSTQR
jgi:hypothetical protein